MKYDEHWVAPWRQPEIGVCRAGDECQSKPPHRMLACTLTDGFCRPCAEKRKIGSSPVPVVVEQLTLGL